MVDDYYAGFPAGQFYFPLPAVLIVLLDVVLPYNVAFKLVTALGPVPLPGARTCSGGASAPAARTSAVRGRRHRLPLLQGRRRRDDALRPPHHGRHAHEHARGRVLVHDRARLALFFLGRRVALDRSARCGRRVLLAATA